MNRTFSGDVPPGPTTGQESTIGNSGLDLFTDYSLEFRLESPADQRLRWRVGLFYYEQEREDEDVAFPNLMRSRYRSNSMGQLVNSMGQRVNGDFRVINAAGQLINTDGDPVDDMGRRINAQNHLIDSGGELIDDMGRLVNAAGQILATSGDPVDDMGRRINPDNQLIDSMNNRVDAMGRRINAAGQLLNTDGNPVDAMGRRINSDNHILDSLGRLIQEDSSMWYLVDTDGNYINGDMMRVMLHTDGMYYITNDDGNFITAAGVVITDPATESGQVSGRLQIADGPDVGRIATPGVVTLTIDQSAVVNSAFIESGEADSTVYTVPLDGYTTSEAKLINQALFGSVSYDIRDNLAVDVELRWQSETKDQEDFNSTTGTTFGDKTFNRKDSWQALTPRVTLSWQPGERTTVFAVYGQGIKPGGFNGSGGQRAGQPTYEQEEADSYELGVKHVWGGGRLLTNASLYFTDMSKIQGTLPIPSTGSATTSIVQNKGEGEVLGFELEARWLMTSWMELGFSYALADSEFTEGCDDFQWALTSGGTASSSNLGGNYNIREFVGSACTPVANDPNRPIVNRSGMGNASIKGNQFAFSPKHVAGLTLDFSFPFRGLELVAGIGASYESKKYVQVHNGAYVDASVDVSANIGVQSQRWSVSLFGRNLTGEDEPVLATRWVSPFFGTVPRYYFANPRPDTMVGLEFRINL